MYVDCSIKKIVENISKSKVDLESFIETILYEKQTNSKFPDFGNNYGEWRNFLGELYFGEMISNVEKDEEINFDFPLIYNSNFKIDRYVIRQNSFGRTYVDYLFKDSKTAKSSYEYDFLTFVNNIPVVFEVELNLGFLDDSKRFKKRFDVENIEKKIEPLKKIYNCDVGIVNVISGYDKMIFSSIENQSCYKDFIYNGGLILPIKYSKEEFEDKVVIPIANIINSSYNNNNLKKKYL